MLHVDMQQPVSHDLSSTEDMLLYFRRMHVQEFERDLRAALEIPNGVSFRTHTTEDAVRLRGAVDELLKKRDAWECESIAIALDSLARSSA